MRETSGTRTGSLAILALVVSALLAPASRSATPDTSEWKCESCPFAKGHVAEATVGSSYVSDDAATFGDATGYDAKGGYLEIAGHGHQATATHRLDWRVEDLGVDSRRIEIDGASTGTFDYRLSYRQLPRHRFDTTRTIFSHTGDNLLALPPAWTVAGTTAGLTDLAASLVSRDIEGERQVFALGGGYRPTSRFRLFADFERQENDGTSVQGAPYFTHASLLPRYFDYRTDQVDAGIRYDAERGYLKLAYYGSFFDNRFDAIRWQSPFTTAPGAEQSALAEAPDNDFQQLVLTGSYRAAMFDTRISFSAAMGRGQQNEVLLPYTTNANLLTAPLPVSALDGEIDTTNLALTVTARPLPKARVKLAVRVDERDNRTPSLAWSRVIADSFLSGESDLNRPYGYERLRMNL
jgi:MtrB/PioB family decaheme-associated outer membrane protein